MKLSQMRYFVTVCAYNNVTHAAAALHISQPSVSGAIRELEEEFGVSLFHRLNRRLKLTQEGEYFLARAREILAQTDALHTHMLDLGNRKNLIRIGVPPMIGTVLFPGVFDAFHTLHPDIEVEIVEHGSLRIRNLVKKEELDVAFAIVEEETSPTLQQLHILSTTLLYCVSRTHPLAGLGKVSLPQLAGQPLILFKKDSVQNALVTQRFAQAGIQPNVLLSSSQLYTIEKFIAKGQAGAFLFKEIADMEPDIVGIPLKTPIHIDIGLVWKKDRHVYSDTARFIEFTKAYRRGGNIAAK